MTMIKLPALGAMIVFASAAPALADPSGFVSFGFGPTSQTDKIFDETFYGAALELAASGVYQFTPEVGVQGDVVVLRQGIKVFDVDTVSTDFDGALHLFFRNDAFLLGGFVQGGSSHFVTNSYDGYTSEEAMVGGEAQVYFDNLTVYAKAGATEAYADGDSIGSGWFADLELRYFITDNFRVEAHAGGATFSPIYGNTDVNYLRIGVGAEYKPDDLPFSLFGRLDYIGTDNSGFIDKSDVRVLVGARFAFGEESLKARDRSGATLTPVPPVPSNFIIWEPN